MSNHNYNLYDFTDEQISYIESIVSKNDPFGYSFAWACVCVVLDELSPGWALGPGSGVECAIRTIRSLAKRKESSDE